jgi:hypothetical protein
MDVAEGSCPVAVGGRILWPHTRSMHHVVELVLTSQSFDRLLLSAAYDTFGFSARRAIKKLSNVLRGCHWLMRQARCPMYQLRPHFIIRIVHLSR